MSRAFTGGSHLISQAAAPTSQLAAMTLCAWVKLTGDGLEAPVILVKDPLATFSTELYISQVSADISPFANRAIGGQTSADNYITQAESDSAVAGPVINTWVQYAHTFSYVTGGFIKLYLNGVEVSYNSVAHSSLPAQSPIDDSAGGWYIGNNTEGNYLQGEMADVRIYNTVLTPTQIALVAAGGTSASSNLVAWWKMLDSNPFADSSGNGNTLTNVGTTPGTSNPPIGAMMYSVPDDRTYGNFPNDSRDVQGTLTYDVPKTFSLKYWFDTVFNRTKSLPVDSRVSVPVDSRTAPNIPMNSRTDPPF